MKTREDLCKEFAAARDGAEAILKKADEDNRQLTDEERKEFDELTGQAEQAKAAIEQIDADQERRNRAAALADVDSTPRPTQTSRTTPVADRISGQRTQDQIIHSAVSRAGRLTAFDGPRAEYNAYLSGQWLRGVLFGDRQALDWCRQHVEGLAMATDNNNAGGALVPQEFESAIIRLVTEYGVARQVCYVHQMISDSVVIPRRTSGVTAYAVSDNVEVTASDAGYDQVELTARKWGALCKYSSELAADAVIQLADELAREIALAFATKEDQCLVDGDGTSTYHGINGLKNAMAAGSKNTAATGNTAFSTLDLSDFENMVGKLPRYPGIAPSWLIHPSAFAASMQRLMDAAGGNTIDHLERGPSGRQFLGYPVVLSNACNSTLTAQTSTDGLCFFGDYRLSVVFGARSGVRIKVSEHRYLELDQIGILGTERMDINFHDVGTASAAGGVIGMTTPGS